MNLHGVSSAVRGGAEWRRWILVCSSAFAAVSATPKMTTELPPLHGEMTMSQVLAAYPGAQRALFARYHIGGCRSCGFQPSETLTQVCQRNENVPVDEAIAHIRDSHQADASIQISPRDFEAMRRAQPDLSILDVRTREEHDAVRVPGARLLTQELVQEIFTTGDKTKTLVLYDHTGSRSLDAAAYFIGHGFAETKCLTGGIDAYSLEVDRSLPRYRIEIEA
jgi:rhodanese-related sulfurtransferase